MSATESSNSSVTPPVSPPIKIRYRFEMAPDRIIDTDPSVVETIRAMDKIDGAVLAGTTLVPAIYGYRIQSNSTLYAQIFGLGAGLFAGAVYAYCRCYARLTGISIPTPKISNNSNN